MRIRITGMAEAAFGFIKDESYPVRPIMLVTVKMFFAF